MPYIGNNHIAGDHTNNFKVLDDISSYTATFNAIVLATTNITPLQSLTIVTRTTAQTIDLHGRSMAVRTRGSVNIPIAFNLT